MNKKTVSISLPQIEGIELKSATVDLEKGVVVAEYGQEDGQEDIEKDISEIAVNYRRAKDYLLEDLHRPYFITTKKQMPKLEALSQLLILAEAWNMFDEFKPDWDNSEQDKWYPVFESKWGVFVFVESFATAFILDPHISSFSFKTRERAEQFGKQFIELFRIVLSN